jgi:UDP:flavonoid glycosyltransferase YjiC (YdhE family)
MVFPDSNRQLPPTPDGGVLFYALGGGCGHVSRSLAVIHTLGIDRATILASTSPCPDFEVRTGVRLLTPPAASVDAPDRVAAWVADCMAQSHACTVVVDTFPCGLFRELGEVLGNARVPLWHVARRLDWRAYALQTEMREMFAVTLAVEPLEPGQEMFVREASRVIYRCELIDQVIPPGPGAAELERLIKRPGAPVWMVVHAGTESECRRLIDYARSMAVAERIDPTLVLVTADCPAMVIDKVKVVPLYPAWPFFGRVDRVVSAGGFNTVRQMARVVTPHRILPFERRYDDQHLRAARARRAAVDVEAAEGPRGP